MDKSAKSKDQGEHPLARWVEQLEPEHVSWLMEQGYCTKDKQATRLTAEGNAWLHLLEQQTSAWLRQVGILRGEDNVSHHNSD